MEQEFDEKKQKHFQETMNRLTAANHVQIEYFEKHQKVDGYSEYALEKNWFGCDRLMKQDNMFGTVQLAYQPNRERVFLFANLKTSRYDTISSKYQKEMQDYQKKKLMKGENENYAYISNPRELSFVLIEKKENKPWTKDSIRPYLKRNNAKTLQKVFPFLIKEEELQRLRKIRKKQKAIQEQIRNIQKQNLSQELDFNEKREKFLKSEQEKRILRKEAVENLTQENFLQIILQRKDSAENTFFRRINYAYDFQKKDIEEYYREKRKTLKETKLEAEPTDEGEEEKN